MLALCLRAVLISSPDTWDWTRMHALAVMHRWTLCENVDSAKIKVPFYTTDIDILRMALMHRIVIHHINISIHIDQSLHPYCSPVSCLTYDVSLCTCTAFIWSIRTVCIFLSMNRVTFIYSIFIVKKVSRLVVYRFIVFFFTSLLCACIYVAPCGSCEAWHFVPLYVPTCSGMTIKLNLTWRESLSGSVPKTVLIIVWSYA